MNIVIQQINKADLFAGIFQHIKVFTEQVNVLFEKDRMYMQTMDGARVSIIEMELPSEWFDVYEHKSPSTITLGINSAILFRVLNTREKTQSIRIVYDPENHGDRLNISFTSDNKSEFDKFFELPLIDLDTDLMEIPAIDYQAEFELSSPHFSSVINQLQLFGDTMDIECGEEKIMLCANSLDSGKMHVEIKIDDLTTFAIDEGKIINVSFSLQYLHNICLYNKLAKEIEIKLSDSYPIQLVYDLGGEHGHNGKIKFFLAPKIKDDE
jgi:proliferating cell nuclear antigen PCNA